MWPVPAGVPADASVAINLRWYHTVVCGRGRTGSLPGGGGHELVGALPFSASSSLPRMAMSP